MKNTPSNLELAEFDLELTFVREDWRQWVVEETGVSIDPLPTFADNEQILKHKKKVADISNMVPSELTFEISRLLFQISSRNFSAEGFANFLTKRKESVLSWSTLQRKEGLVAHQVRSNNEVKQKAEDVVSGRDLNVVEATWQEMGDTETGLIAQAREESEKRGRPMLNASIIAALLIQDYGHSTVLRTLKALDEFNLIERTPPKPHQWITNHERLLLPYQRYLLGCWEILTGDT